jgi:hypothetical protein
MKNIRTDEITVIVGMRSTGNTHGMTDIPMIPIEVVWPVCLPYKNYPYDMSL